MADAIITPWEVKGTVDYDKLIKDFGTSKISAELKQRMKKLFGELHVMLSRDIYYSHRDLDAIIGELEAGRKIFIYTGIGPSSEMHIGHIIPFAFTKWLQEKTGANLYVQVTDDEKFLFKKERKLEDIERIADDDILNVIAQGFDPDKTFIFKDTEYIRNMYKLATRIAKEVNFSTMKSVFGFTNSTNVGMIFYPTLQMEPTFFENSYCLIPAAIDQDPYWRVQRDIAEKLGYRKAAQIHSKFLPPLTGIEGKMSASHPDTAILLSDDEKTVERKVMKYAFSGGQQSVELHRKLGGNPDVDVSFQWLSYMFEPDDKKLKQIEDDYRSGRLLSGEMKQILVEKLNSFLSEQRKRKEQAHKLVEKFMYTGALARKMWDTYYE
ncbi:MAG: tryptophan--tRNA ligase [Candidatus Micrarchaeia archaeon]